MDGLKISQAARATGFTVSALRFYEKEGVVVPERTATGYRAYGDDHLEALRFVTRGKQLGLSLEDITELLGLLDDEECGPVQTRIRHLVGDRISQAQEQIAELVAFTSQLQAAAARLGVHTPGGACDEECGCRSEPHQAALEDRGRPIPLAGAASSEVTCSLPADSVRERIQHWQRMLEAATARLAIPGGVRVVFRGDVDVAALARSRESTLGSEHGGLCTWIPTLRQQHSGSHKEP